MLESTPTPASEMAVSDQPSEFDVERCIRLFLGMAGALNQWTDLFKSVTPTGDENWREIRKNRNKISAYLEAIKVASSECLCSAEELGAHGLPRDVELRLVGCLASAGKTGERIAKHALKPLSWSSGWVTWQKVSMMPDADDARVACRDGLRKAYEMTGREFEEVGHDMLFAEPLNRAREALARIARDLRVNASPPMSYKKIAEQIRINHAELIAEAAPNEKDNVLYPSGSTIRRLIRGESELDGL